MQIAPIPYVSGGGCDALVDITTSCSSLTPLPDVQHHSLAWLSRHCPQAASHLQAQLAQMELIRQAAINQKPIDLWIQTAVMDDLAVDTSHEDCFEKRSLLSESVANEDDDFDDDPNSPQTFQPEPKLDHTLIPAGVLSVPLVGQVIKTPEKTAPTTRDATPAPRQGWMMRVSMLVLLGLAVEGLLAKWLLG